jgi:hypothetical protein
MNALNDPGADGPLSGVEATTLAPTPAPKTVQFAKDPVSNPGFKTRFADTWPATNSSAPAHTVLPMNLLIPFIIATLTFRLLCFLYPIQRLATADTFLLQIICNFYQAGLEMIADRWDTIHVLLQKFESFPLPIGTPYSPMCKGLQNGASLSIRFGILLDARV